MWKCDIIPLEQTLEKITSVVLRGLFYGKKNEAYRRAVEEYLKGEGSYESIAKKYGIGKRTFLSE